MAAIPAAECASGARRGVMRALCRVAVLSGLVIAGWLVGAGTSHADEDPGGPRGGGVSQIADAAPSDDGSAGSFGVDKMIKSTVGAALAPDSISRVPIHPPAVKRGVLTPLHRPLTPVLKSVSVPQRLTHVLTPVNRTLPAPAPHSAAPQPPAPVGTPASAAAPQAVATVRPAVEKQPAPVRTPDTRTGPRNITAWAPAPSGAQHAASPPALHGAYPAPDPSAPLDNPPVTCMIGSTGGSASTRGAPDATQADSWRATRIVPIRTLRYPGTGDLPRSPAAQPSTSPD